MLIILPTRKSVGQGFSKGIEYRAEFQRMTEPGCGGNTFRMFPAKWLLVALSLSAVAAVKQF